MAPLAIDNDALVVATRGSIFIAPANTPMPAGGLNDFVAHINGASVTPSGWERLANTSRENLPAFEIEEGDVSQLGTWDNEVVRTVYGTNTVRYTLSPTQHDKATVAKIVNGWTVSDGAVMAATGWAFTAAVVIVVMDGPTMSGFYIPNNDARATGLPSLAVAAFSEMQLTMTAKPATAEAIPVHTDGRTGLMRIFEPTAYVPPTP